MRNVLICSVHSPFASGRAESRTSDLERHLTRRGFRVETVQVPFKREPVKDLVQQALVWRLFDLLESNGTAIDMVIATQFPSYVVSHPYKVTWLSGQHREAYDLCGTAYSPFEATAEHNGVRDAIRAMDLRALAESQALFALSQTVANRLQRHTGLAAEPLYAPPQHAGRYRNDGYGDYVLFHGRLDARSRPDLLVRAWAHVRSGARLEIAGSGPLERDLRALISQLGIEDRVDLHGSLSDEDLLRLCTGCRAACQAPFDEDDGEAAIEALLSEKPVLTTTDAGAPLEIVVDGENGLVAEPEPQAIADAVDRLFRLPETRLREMGAAGRRRVRDVSWDRVVDRLTEIPR